MASSDEPGAIDDAIEPDDVATAGQDAASAAPGQLDFRRPPPLATQQQHAISAMQDDLAGMLEPLIASRLRMPSPIRPTGSETVAADDLVASDVAALYVMLELAPLPGRSILRLPLGMALVAIDVLLGGNGALVDADRPITEIELEVLTTLLERWTEPIRLAWAPIGDVAVRMGTVLVDAAAARAACDPQPYLRIGFELTLGELSHEFDLWVPAGGMAAQAREELPDAATHRTAVQPVLASVLHDIPVEVTVGFPSTGVPSHTLLSLRPGDVIPLDCHVDEALDLRVGDLDVGAVRPARSGRKVACQVIVGPGRHHIRPIATA
jgi:flagellar motor switch protein FliM